MNVSGVAAPGERLWAGARIDDAELTPVVSAGQLERVTGFTDRAVAAGASAATGGAVLDRPGWFMAPTVLVDVDPVSEVARDEVFCPGVTVLRAGSVEQAIGIANGTDYGLAAGVFTRDLDRALWTADRLVAGQVFVNELYAGGRGETPFGGVSSPGSAVRRVRRRGAPTCRPRTSAYASPIHARDDVTLCDAPSA